MLDVRSLPWRMGQITKKKEKKPNKPSIDVT